jgi:glycosyltransferase involved in cell wall biosynthesis
LSSSKPTIHLFTRNYPFGRNESFVEEEISRLQQYGEVVVVPAFRDHSDPRKLPNGVQLETSLARCSMLSGLKSFSVMMSVLSQLPGEIINRGVKSLRIKSQFAIWSYILRISRFTHWILRSDAGKGVHKAMSFWSNSEAVGLALATIHRTELRFVSRLHGFDIWEKNNFYGYLPFRALLYEHALFLLPCSAIGAKYLRATVSNADRVVVAPLGVDRLLEPNYEKCNRTIEEAVILTCSSGDPVKRLSLIAETIVVLAKKNPDRSWTWIHLGEGQEQFQTKLKEAPRNLKVELPGPVSRLEVFRYHRDRCPDVFVNLSSSEGIPVTIMEAMSMGTPVVATAAGGTGEIVDSTIGKLLPVEIDSNNAARAIRNVINTSHAKRTAAIERWRNAASIEVAQKVLDRIVPKLIRG